MPDCVLLRLFNYSSTHFIEKIAENFPEAEKIILVMANLRTQVK
jgi:hypothetical protein